MTEKPTSPRTERIAEIVAEFNEDRDQTDDRVAVENLARALAWAEAAAATPSLREHRPIKRIRNRQTEERCMVDGEFWPCSTTTDRAAAATPSLPDEWLLSISIMEAARRIDLEMSVGHSWRELAMLTNAILADQYRAASPVSRSQLSLSPVSASLDALHKTLADALHELMDHEECRFDHHGNCQEHGVSKPCVMQQARDAMRDYGLALARLDEGSATPDPDMDEKCAKCGHTYGNHVPGGCSQPGPTCPCTGFLHRYSFPPGSAAPDQGKGEPR